MTNPKKHNFTGVNAKRRKSTNERKAGPRPSDIVNARIRAEGTEIDLRRVPGEPKPLGDIDDGCRWPGPGEPSDRSNICGHAREDGSSYCSAHHQRAYDRMPRARAEFVIRNSFVGAVEKVA